jgi:hypothetical protein
MRVSQRYTLNIAFEEETQTALYQVITKQKPLSPVHTKQETDAMLSQTDVFTILLHARLALEERSDEAIYREMEGKMKGDANNFSVGSQLYKVASRLSLIMLSTKETSYSSNSTSTISLFSRQESSKSIRPVFAKSA